MPGEQIGKCDVDNLASIGKGYFYGTGLGLCIGVLAYFIQVSDDPAVCISTPGMLGSLIGVIKGHKDYQSSLAKAPARNNAAIDALEDYMPDTFDVMAGYLDDNDQRRIEECKEFTPNFFQKTTYENIYNKEKKDFREICKQEKENRGSRSLEVV